MRNKKTVITITSIVAVLLVIIGVTYAYWLLTKTQTGHNLLSSGCLDISLTGEKNDIELQDQFPLSDEDGMKLTPYEFTVTNNCTTSVDYQVNLESIGDSTNAIKASAIKVALNDEIKLLTAGGNTEPTVSGAYESNMILYGTLAGSSEDTSEDTVTYELRIWIDENAPISEQNKTFQSKISVTIGQGVINPYKEGTLAYDILSNYGGADAITSLSAEWTEGDASTVTASSQNLGTSNSYWYGTTYKFDKKTGKYTLSGTLTQATLEECRNGTKTCGNYTLRDAEKNYSAKRLFQITEFGTEGNNVTAKILSSYNMFSKDLTSYDAGLYKAQDDLGETFIFRGNVTNNYVKFGTYAKDTTVTVYDTVNSIRKEIPILEESPMYWRIVRINGDGTIRMIYDGIEKIENSNVNSFASIGLGMFIDYSLDSNDEKYVGYTYDENGIQTKVLVKNILDLWYSNNIKGRFDNWVSDGIFCNDKSAKYQYLDDYYHETTPELSTTRKIFFETQNRKENFSPSLKCENKSDRYAVSDKLGNGYFEYSVGLITMDEVQIIGPSSYLYTNTRFWTASPAHNNYGLYMYTLDPTYGLSQDYVRNEINVRPVINLKANVKFTGDGSYGTPYEIVMN